MQAEASRGAAASAMTALIVDDSAVARSILARALRLSGVSVGRILEATDGAKGLDVLEREPVSLALVDLNMPNMGGMELLERARAVPAFAKTPIVVVSTEGSEVQIAKVKALGAAFLRKPFTPESLVDVVESVLASRAPSKYDQTMFQVSARVLAELCFLLPEDPSDDPLAEEDMIVGVRYSGHSSGQVTLAFGGLDLAAIAGDMMGVARDEALAEDAARELANVVCGHVLPVVYGAKAVYRLAAPTVGLAPVANEPLVGEALLRVHGGHVRARLYGKDPET